MADFLTAQTSIALANAKDILEDLKPDIESYLNADNPTLINDAVNAYQAATRAQSMAKMLHDAVRAADATDTTKQQTRRPELGALKALCEIEGRHLLPVDKQRRPFGHTGVWKETWLTSTHSTASILHQAKSGTDIAVVPASIGMWVIDIDADLGAYVEAMFKDILGAPLAIVETPSGGLHLWYGFPDDIAACKGERWGLGEARGDIYHADHYVVLWDPIHVAEAARMVHHKQVSCVSPGPIMINRSIDRAPGMAPLVFHPDDRVTYWPEPGNPCRHGTVMPVIPIFAKENIVPVCFDDAPSIVEGVDGRRLRLKT